MSFKETIANELRGIKTLKDWGDDGFVPVLPAIAQARANVCLGVPGGTPCPHNQDKVIDFNTPIAGLIKSHIEKKAGTKLAVNGEEKLHICMLCSCVLKLKVFTPLETLLGRMDAATISKFKTEYPICWINKQTTQTPTP